jgi:hypothetical protein
MTDAAELVGGQALLKDLSAMAAANGALARNLTEAGKQVGNPVAAVTRGALPQVSGRLAGDVRVEVDSDGPGADVVMGRSSLRYAGWIEFGGHRRVPHPSYREYDPRGRYLWPNAITVPAKAVTAFSAATQKTLDGYPWSNRGADPGSIHD